MEGSEERGGEKGGSEEREGVRKGRKGEKGGSEEREGVREGRE